MLRKNRHGLISPSARLSENRIMVGMNHIARIVSLAPQEIDFYLLSMYQLIFQCRYSYLCKTSANWNSAQRPSRAFSLCFALFNLGLLSLSLEVGYLPSPRWNAPPPRRKCSWNWLFNIGATLCKRPCNMVFLCSFFRFALRLRHDLYSTVTAHHADMTLGTRATISRPDMFDESSNKCALHKDSTQRQ